MSFSLCPTRPTKALRIPYPLDPPGVTVADWCWLLMEQHFFGIEVTYLSIHSRRVGYALTGHQEEGNGRREALRIGGMELEYERVPIQHDYP